jgi:two-component system, probable response regulator PhcQ
MNEPGAIMEAQYDYKKFAILYVDDEEKSLKGFARAFEDEFRIYTATNAQDGARLLAEKPGEVAILMTDQRMPGEKGTWLLERARETSPETLRILVTAFAEFKDAVAAINDGGIYHYVNKPWDPAQLEGILKRAMEFFLTQRERDQLMKEKMEALRNLMVADRLVSLGMLAAGLSHHIRNALVTVKTFLDLSPSMMQEEKTDPKAVRHQEFWGDYHRSVLGQIDKINNLLKDLWAASEKPPTKLADQVRLQTVVAEATTSLGAALAAKKVQVENLIQDDLPVVIGDKAKLHRLFELVLKEELANVPEGTLVTFSASVVAGDMPGVRLEIKDNGPGLPPEALQFLFDPFMVRTDSPSEYGIHLLACFFIVHHHGGRIEAASSPGKGTMFTIHLPLDADRTLSGLNQGLLQKSRLAEQVWGGVRHGG